MRRFLFDLRSHGDGIANGEERTAQSIDGDVVVLNSYVECWSYPA